MKYLILIIITTISLSSFGQNLHYFRIHMGPKMEFHSIQNSSNVEMVPHIDVGAGFYLGKRFTKNISAELGIIKNDYSARFQINTQNLAGNDVAVFRDKVYPTYSSYQLGILGSYRGNLSEKWVAYGKVGFHIFLKKELDRTGSEFFVEEISTDGSFSESMDVTLYSNDFEGGILVFRGDAGVYRNISDDLALDLCISGRVSNLPVNQFSLEYQQNWNVPEKNILITNSAASLGFYLGIKYKINNL
jgi:hypothetical protein